MLHYYFFYLSKIAFPTPLSIIVANIFFNIIKTIGPINIPNTPIILNPVYIAIRVKIGCIPMCLLTTLGSANCLIIDIITHNITTASARFISPFIADITAHGIIAVPEPSIGSASTKPIPSAASSGYFIFKPINLKIYNPINDTTNDISTSVTSAFKYPPKLLIKSLPMSSYSFYPFFG